MGQGGQIEATISYCYAKGSVNTIASTGYTGGFAGYLSSDASFCYATGNVKAEINE